MTDFKESTKLFGTAIKDDTGRHLGTAYRATWEEA